MRGISRRLSRFCYNHPKFAIPNLMKYIVAGQAIVWLLDWIVGIMGFGPVSGLLAFIPNQVFRGQVWRLITFVFVPAHSQLLYLILSLYMYYLLGDQLERIWGSARFTVYYLLGVFLTVLCGLALKLTDGGIWVTTTYVNFSLFLAFATLFPDALFRIIFIPIRGKWLALIYVILIGLDVVTWLQNGQLLLALVPAVSLLNWLFFFFDDLFPGKRPAPVRTRHAAGKPTDLRSAQHQIKKQKGYLHKCVICGITDQDDRDMEFRYCSRCEGYHCYCANHINDHTHIQ